MASEVRFADIRRVLEQHGWKLVRTPSSHRIFAKEGEPNLSIPVHHEKVRPVYVRKVEKALGVRIR